MLSKVGLHTADVDIGSFVHFVPAFVLCSTFGFTVNLGQIFGVN